MRSIKVVERKQAAHENLPRRDPAAAPCPRRRAPCKIAHPRIRHTRPMPFDTGRMLFDGHALRDEGVDGPANLLVVATQEARPLRAGEDAAV